MCITEVKNRNNEIKQKNNVKKVNKNEKMMDKSKLDNKIERIVGGKNYGEETKEERFGFDSDKGKP